MTTDSMVEIKPKRIALKTIRGDTADPRTVEKFLALVQKTGDDDCWEWLGRYGMTVRNNGIRYAYFAKGTRATRFYWELHNKRPIPPGMVVRHRCDNSRCVNPTHLELGTQLQNVQDRDRRGRNRAAKGSKHGNSKLNEHMVREIRLRYASGHKTRQLSEEYGVTKFAIYYVTHGGWPHVR